MYLILSQIPRNNGSNPKPIIMSILCLRISNSTKLLSHLISLNTAKIRLNMWS